MTDFDLTKMFKIPAFKSSEAYGIYQNKSSHGCTIMPNRSLYDPIDEINKCANSKCSENELLDCIKKYHTDTFPQNYNNYNDMFKFIVENAYDGVIDLILLGNRNCVQIVQYICLYTDNVELYIKYYSQMIQGAKNGQMVTDDLENIILSFCYQNEPGKLTSYIVDNYQKQSTSLTIFRYLASKFDIDISADCVEYIITQFKLSVDNIYVENYICKTWTSEQIVKIMKLLITDNISDYNKIFIMVPIVELCLASDIKYFVELLNPSINLLCSLSSKSKNLDQFEYFFELIGSDNFDESQLFNYEITQRLIDLGFNPRPDLIYCPDKQTFILVILDAIIKSDYDYVNKNIRYIIMVVFENYVSNHELLMQIIELAKLKILNLNILFEKVILHDNYDILNLLIDNNIECTNIQDIIDDLILLNNTSMIEYVNQHYKKLII